MREERLTCGPKLSVVVPVYKVEKFLSRCIDSLLAQDYENIEVVLVDDGSPDRCPEICDRYAKADKRVKVVHKCNGGLCSARNAGIDVSTGDYITFVDSDDWVENNAYTPLISYMSDNQLDIIGGVYRYVRPWKVEDKVLQKATDESVRELSPEQALNELYFGAQQFAPMSIMVWNKIYRKELFDDLRFPEGYIHEDVFMTPLLLDKAKRIGCMDHLMYNYNIHLGAASTSGMDVSLHKVESSIEMNRRVFVHFGDSPFRRIAHRTASLYFNTLLNAYYECHRHRGTSPDWRCKELELRREITTQKSLIQSVCQSSKPFKVFFVSYHLFLALKAGTIKGKRLKYRLHCMLTGKN